MSAHVLVADPDPARRAELSARMEADGYEVHRAESAADAVRSARALLPQAVVLELDADAKAALAALDELVDMENAPSVVLVTDDVDVPTAVDAMRRGAESVLPRPFEPDALLAVLRCALLRRRVSATSLSGSSEDRCESGEPPWIARSPAMQRVLAHIDRIAAFADATVLIQGEPGTGKELVARRIHARSSRSRAPFVPIACAALSEPRAGSEPSFGILRDVLGEATGGTLFFDEIGELPPALQAKLASILREKSSRSAAAWDVRVVASTTRDLEASVAAGAFRADLFYGLNVLAVRVPALRERAADVPELAAMFLAAAGAKLGRTFRGFTQRALEQLAGYAWPGNVRELENAIVRAATTESSSLVRPGHFGLAQTPRPPVVEGSRASNADPADRTLRTLEQDHILRVLREARGNRSLAARWLGVNRTTLYAKLKRYGLDRTVFAAHE